MKTHVINFFGKKKFEKFPFKTKGLEGKKKKLSHLRQPIFSLFLILFLFFLTVFFRDSLHLSHLLQHLLPVSHVSRVFLWDRRSFSFPSIRFLHIFCFYTIFPILLAIHLYVSGHKSYWIFLSLSIHFIFSNIFFFLFILSHFLSCPFHSHLLSHSLSPSLSLSLSRHFLTLASLLSASSLHT